MGERRVYQKLRKDSVCYNGRGHKSQENAAPCECTHYDYKCDFGYKRSQGLLSKMYIYIYVLFCADVIEVFFVEIIKDEKTCEKDDEQLSMDHICIDGKEEEITSSVSPVD